MSELKPCPFCGGKAEIDIHDNVFCRCSLYEKGDYWPINLSRWNTRPIEDELQRKLDIAIEGIVEAMTCEGTPPLAWNILRKTMNVLEGNDQVIGTWQCQWCGAIHTTDDIHCPCEGKPID